ncbi:protein LTO1 homolog [Corticium candelabrum]|uniref:protein LTO1 homolog n=1 Tax=Corticium candelabrum TaxID=121492 RepID=UPI002E26BF96|nr:protein LTO1 homolog [Corticium candelabrum]
MQDADVVDACFDNIFLSEDRERDRSYREGLAEGQALGLVEGRRLGLEKGKEIGGELGFYAGFGEVLVKVSKSEIPTRGRAQKCLEQLLIMIAEFPVDKPTDPNLQEKIKKIRAKFKQVTSLFNIKLEYEKETEPKLSY